MPRRSILSATERESLLVLSDAKDELIRTCVNDWNCWRNSSPRSTAWRQPMTCRTPLSPQRRA
jgi:hypothetical protein